MITLSVDAGTPAGFQLEAVFQSVDVAPVQVGICHCAYNVTLDVNEYDAPSE
jgi:hypothetical protein